jgi:tetratricopeptide (TPR) repeat protein
VKPRRRAQTFCYIPRVLYVVLSALLSVESAAPQQRNDTRTWYQAYADAQRNIQQKNWQAAIADVEAASRRGAPKPGRNVLFYGDVYRDFNPDYYLGIAYLNLQRYDEADRAFERVKQAQLIGARDSQYGEFTRQASAAKDLLEKQQTAQRTADLAAANPPANRPANAAGNAPPETQPPPTPTPVAPVTPVNLGNPTNVLPGTGDPIAQAPVNAPSPIQQGLQQTPRPQNSYRPNPSNNAARQSPPRASAGFSAAAAAAEERSALVEFYSGQYEAARTRLWALMDGGRISPRGYFYLACSRAALALTGKPDDDNVIPEAQAQLKLAGDTNQFTADKVLISPRIRQVLGILP